MREGEEKDMAKGLDPDTVTGRTIGDALYNLVGWAGFITLIYLIFAALGWVPMPGWLQ